jgi:hypothetical protein
MREAALNSASMSKLKQAREADTGKEMEGKGLEPAKKRPRLVKKPQVGQPSNDTGTVAQWSERATSNCYANINQAPLSSAATRAHPQLYKWNAWCKLSTTSKDWIFLIHVFLQIDFYIAQLIVTNLLRAW